MREVGQQRLHLHKKTAALTTLISVPGSGQKIGAPLLENFRGREEIFAQIERGRRPVCCELDAMLYCDIGEAAGDIRPTGEHHALDLRADRGQRGADIVAAIEEG